MFNFGIRAPLANPEWLYPGMCLIVSNFLVGTGAITDTLLIGTDPVKSHSNRSGLVITMCMCIIAWPVTQLYSWVVQGILSNEHYILSKSWVYFPNGKGVSWSIEYTVSMVKWLDSALRETTKLFYLSQYTSRCYCILFNW